MKKFITVVFLLAGMQLHAQRWAEKMAETMLSTGIVVEQQNKDHFAKSIYDQSLALKGIEGVWFRTGDKKYFDFIQKTADAIVNENGSMKTSPGTGETDALLLGRNLLMLYKVLGKEKYYKAAATLHKQAKSRGGTSAGSLSNQMNLDGWYKSGTFQADWARTFHDAAALDDIASQFKWMERYARDAKSGLLYNVHGNQRTVATFAKNTRSATPFDPCAMAWFGMGLVDVIEHLPETHTGRDSLVQVLGRFATAAVKFQDKKTGLWNSAAADGPTEKNPEVAASSMLVYTLAKGVRLGALPSRHLTAAKKGYQGIVSYFIKTENGRVKLYSTSNILKEGANTNSEQTVNNPLNVGAFLLAANEAEIIPSRAVGKNKLVILDNYFNQETKKDITGKTLPYHYLWDEMDNNGYSLLGEIFKQNGGKISTLSEAPVYENLSAASVYIIVDPDTEKEKTNPNYMQPEHVKAIYKWVKEGGVLALFLNDSANAEFDHFNALSEKFGIRFNFDDKNKVRGNNFEDGAIYIPAKNPVFKTAKKVFIKELSTLKVSKPAVPILKKDGYDIIATAKLGHGFVIAVGDPWLYNEYTDGRKLPPDFENYQAAQDLVKWLLTIKTNKNDIIPWKK